MQDSFTILSGHGIFRFSLLSEPQQHFCGKPFDSLKPVKNALGKFFNSKPDEFYSNGIYKMVNHWEQVIDNDRKHIGK